MNVDEQPLTVTATAKRPNHPVVLLVDDQPMVAEGIRRMLMEESNIAFHYCSDPRQAVKMALEIEPTIILQDLIMPDVDGYTLVRQYREHEKIHNIPVIVLSTREDPKDKRLAFENGANDYLIKLPDKIELIARIRANTKNYLTQLERDDAFATLAELQLWPPWWRWLLAQGCRCLAQGSTAAGRFGGALWRGGVRHYPAQYQCRRCNEDCGIFTCSSAGPGNTA
jgi:CheY-like chemotaxis protein